MTRPVELTVLASAARVATVNSADLKNYNCRGVIVVIDATAEVDTASVVAKIQGKDPASGQYYTILESAAIDAVGTRVLVVYPGVTVAANLAASHPLPETWRVRLEHADADALTYSVGACLIP